MRICFIGDSFVNGTGDDDALGWPGRVVSLARSKGLDVTYYNLGVARHERRHMPSLARGSRKTSSARKWRQPTGFFLRRERLRVRCRRKGTIGSCEKYGERGAHIAISIFVAPTIISVPRRCSMTKRAMNVSRGCPAIFTFSAAILASRFLRFSTSSLGAQPGDAKPVKEMALTPTEKVIPR